MARQVVAVRVEGLAELRRDLRATDREVAREVQMALKNSAGIIAMQAALLAPRRTGSLAAGYRPFTRGNVAGVRNPVVYAAVHEFGGTIRPRGTSILIRRSEPITRSVERNTNAVVEALSEGIDAATRHTGWH